MENLEPFLFVGGHLHGEIVYVAGHKAIRAALDDGSMREVEYVYTCLHGVRGRTMDVYRLTSLSDAELLAAVHEFYASGRFQDLGKAQPALYSV